MIRFDSVQRVFPGGDGARRPRPRDRGRRAGRAARPVRLRQDDGAPAPRRLRPPGRRPVLVGDRDVTNVPPNKRDMGMVFQAYSLFPNMDVRTNVAFGLRMRRQEQRARFKRAEDLLELVGSQRRRPLPAPALRRPAAARRARARARDRAARAAARRAAVGARRAGARPAARGDPTHPARARHHDPVRHARPGRGAVDGRPRRRHVRAAASSSSARRRRSTPHRRRRSSRSSSAR